MVTCRFPQLEGVDRIGRHQRLIPPGTVRMGKLGSPKGDAGRNAQRMRRDGVFKQHPLFS